MKNKHQLQRLIGGLIAVVGFVLLFVCSSIQPLFITGIIIAIVGLIWYAIATSNSRRVCDHCGGSMKGCAYDYQTMSAEESTNPNNSSYTLKVKIHATCPHCGTVKTFDKKFYVNDNQNPQFLVDDFCRSHFGH